MTTPSRWLELEARSPSTDPGDGRLAEGLLAMGGRAVQERDGWLVTYLDGDSTGPVSAGGLRDSLVAVTGVDDVEVRIRWQDHEDWAELWKRGLAPRRVTDRIVVAPTWDPVDPSPGELVISLDPGVAFGNAEHGTTRGCIRLLDGVVAAGQRILDVGAGSGILSIVAALLGARSVQALEADPWAIPTALENVRRNGVEARVRVSEARVASDDLETLGRFDGVMSNIETGHLSPLVPGLAAAVGEGGWLLLSGMQDDEVGALEREVIARGFGVEALDADGDWRTVLFRRR